jgi:hypothetical protein
MAPAAAQSNEFTAPKGWNINDSAIVNSDDPQLVYKEYDYIREHCPVAHVDKHGGYWITTKYFKPYAR